MNKLLDIISHYWIIFTLIIISVITVLSLWPLSNLPEAPGGDKLHHFLAYTALMFPTAVRRPKHWILIALFFICWSGGIELIQPYVKRYREWADFAANAGGIIMGFLCSAVFNLFTIKK